MIAALFIGVIAAWKLFIEMPMVILAGLVIVLVIAKIRA